jgi:DNA polymerase III epsilon subunit-like protein
MKEELLRFDNNKKILVLDFETENTCLVPKLNLVWQVGMLKTQGNAFIDSYSAFLKWDRPLNVSEGAAKVTHFDKTKVENNSTDYQQVISKIIEWADWSDWICAHNALGFDIYFLRHFYEMMGKSTVHLAEKILDTHALLKGLKMTPPILFDSKKESLSEYQYKMINLRVKGVKTNLTLIGKEMGIEFNPDTLHDALNDVILLFDIWKQIKYKIEI